MKNLIYNIKLEAEKLQNNTDEELDLKIETIKRRAILQYNQQAN